MTQHQFCCSEICFIFPVSFSLPSRVYAILGVEEKAKLIFERETAKKWFCVSLFACRVHVMQQWGQTLDAGS